MAVEIVQVYDVSERIGIGFVATTGLVSFVAVLHLLVTKLRHLDRKTYKDTYILGYFVSLLISNLFQSSATMMGYEWVKLRHAELGLYCSIQGGVKQIGNLGVAFWSLTIAIHAFHLALLGCRPRRIVIIAALCHVWSFIFLLVVLGPHVIQNVNDGPYFFISGPGCRISAKYRTGQIFLEYIFEFISFMTVPILFTATILRIRGKLTIGANAKSHLQSVSRKQGWKLDKGKDSIDDSTFDPARVVVWYPIAYPVLFTPVVVIRLYEFSGHTVPFWAATVSEIILNLLGLVTFILVLTLERMFPPSPTLPQFSKPCKFSTPKANDVLYVDEAPGDGPPKLIMDSADGRWDIVTVAFPPRKPAKAFAPQAKKLPTRRPPDDYDEHPTQ